MKKLLGGVLLAVGILIAGASGLCSAVFLVEMFSSPGGEFSSLGLILIFGGIPFAAGVGLMTAGLALIRSSERDAGN